MPELTIYGFYKLKNEFFDEMDDPYLKNNKDEKRPFFYCIREQNSDNGIYWLIPMSSRTEKYKRIITEKRAKNRPTDGLYICRLPNDIENAFLIQDIFPVTEEYILGSYTIGENPMILPGEKDRRAVEHKAKKVLILIKKGIKLTPTSPDVMKIYNKLINNRSHTDKQ